MLGQKDKKTERQKDKRLKRRRIGLRRHPVVISKICRCPLQFGSILQMLNSSCSLDSISENIRKISKKFKMEFQKCSSSQVAHQTQTELWLPLLFSFTPWTHSHNNNLERQTYCHSDDSERQSNNSERQTPWTHVIMIVWKDKHLGHV